MMNKYGCLLKNIDFDWLNYKGYFDEVWVYVNNKYNINNRNMIKYVKLYFYISFKMVDFIFCLMVCLIYVIF